MNRFETVIGHIEAKRQLNHDISLGTLSHSYLFTGREGIGKYTLARELAKYFLQVEEDGFDLENHPDCHVIETDEKSIKKKQIEDLIENAGKTTFEAPNQVFLIKDFYKVTPEGQNALLKTLEEPKSEVVLLLTTSKDQLVLPTIVSRCRKVPLYPLSVREVEEYFKREYSGLSEKEIRLYSRLSMGSISQGRKYVENVDLLSLRKRAIEVLIRVVRSNGYYPFEAFTFFQENKDNFSYFMELYRTWFRDLTYMQLGIEKELLHEDLLSLMEKQRELPVSSIYRIIEEIDVTEQNLEYNGNFQLQVENLLLKIQGEYND